MTTPAPEPRPAPEPLPAGAAPVDAETARLFAAADSSHEVLGVLGRGGMGTVYLAREKTLNRPVAYKQLLAEAAEDGASGTELFLREARITARLVHPGIVPVYALLEGIGGRPAYTMKVVEGETLVDLIAEVLKRGLAGDPLTGRLALTHRLDLFVRVCEAVAFAHSRGIQHRDIKPANIMIGPHHEVYVVDWGLAGPLRRAAAAGGGEARGGGGDEARGSGSGSGADAARGFSAAELQALSVGQTAEELGTLGYAAPERIARRFAAVDERSDLYSLGATLYELVFLRPAFPQLEPMEVVKAMNAGRVDNSPPPVREELPRGLAAVIKKAMAVRPEDRYVDVQALADEIRRVIHDEPVAAAPESAFRRAARQVARHREAALVISLVGAMLTIGLAAWWVVAQQQAELRLRELTLRTAARSTAVAEQHREIDRLVFRFEGLLRGLAAGSQLALGHPATPERYYLHQGFAPPDLAYSEFYRDQISVAWPVLRPPPGVALERARETLSRLATLRPLLRNAVWQSAEAIGREVKSASPLLSGELPLLFAFVATRDGALAVFPGRGGYPPDYDPRDAPWFRATVEQRGVRWGRPYVSSQKIRAVVMGCTTAVRTPEGELLAVAGIDLRLAYLVDLLGDLSRREPWIQRALLLDADGGIVARAGELIDSVAGDGMAQRELARSPYWSEEVVAAVRAGRRAGFVEVEWGGRVIYLAFSRLDALDWYYVVEGEALTADGRVVSEFVQTGHGAPEAGTSR